MKRILSFGWMVALLLGLASCTKEDGATVNDGPAALSFAFRKPNAAFVTRADGEIATDNEWFIDVLDVYVADGSGTMTKLVPTQDYTVEGDAATDILTRSYTITMTDAWVARYATQTVNFYFIGNDSISTSAATGSAPGGHDALQSALTTGEAAFRSALTDELGDTDGKLNLLAVDPATGQNLLSPTTPMRGLLFSEVVENVTVTGKVRESGILRRREARFDIINPLVADSTFVVDSIYVTNATAQGAIFRTAAATALDGVTRMNHLTIPGPKNGTSAGGWADGDYGADSLAESVFYLYPTEMGAGKTQIIVMGSLNGEESQAYPVDASGLTVANLIQANTRYILRMNPVVMKFTMEVADYEKEISVPVDPGADKTLTIDNFATSGDGVFDESTFQYEFTSTAGNTLSFDVESKYGTEAKVSYVVGGILATDIQISKTSADSYAGFWTKETYTITVPSSSRMGHHIVMSVESRNGEGKRSFVFTKGWGGYNDILYFANDGTLQVGKWGKEVTRADQLAFFQFGSVVGFGLDGAWDASSSLRFNPTSTASFAYASLPNFTGTAVADYAPRSFDNAYHNLSNVLAGKGDPCRLVGLTVGQIKSFASDSALYAAELGWRLPTSREDVSFVGGPAGGVWESWMHGDAYFFYDVSGAGDAGVIAGNTDYAGNHFPGAFNVPATVVFPLVGGYADADSQVLPAVGRRNDAGDAVEAGSAYFWSGTPSSASLASRLAATSSSARPANDIAFASGHAIRCINPVSTQVSGLENKGRSLRHISNTLSDVISGAENTYTVNVLTNMSGWGVRVYAGADNKGELLVTAPNAFPIDNSADPVESNLQVTIPEYIIAEEIDRQITLYLYAAELAKEIKVGSYTQAFPFIPVVSTALTPGAGDILYFEGTGDNAKLMIGQWDDEVTKENYMTKMAFFKGGSLIGFDLNGSWSASAVQFNPAVDSAYTQYASIPIYTTAPSGWKGTAATSDTISSPEYHNFANIKLGKGDPCQLIGLTAKQIRDAANEAALTALLHARPDEQKGWRLPTPQENGKFVDSATSNPLSEYGSNTYVIWEDKLDWTTGNPYLGKFPVVADANRAANSVTLPMAGNRSGTTGAVSNRGVGSHGFYWSSVPYSETYGYNLTFYNDFLRPMNRNYGGYADGMAIRCVRPVS